MSYKTPAEVVKKNTIILLISVITTFLALRLALSASPETDFDVGAYNVHHLFTGLLLIVAGGLPLALFRGSTLRLDIALIAFGAGLGMALDEWVYLIATDGSNASYLLPVSLWGGIVLISLTCVYAFVLALPRLRKSAGNTGG